jgi:hypothetical protein
LTSAPVLGTTSPDVFSLSTAPHDFATGGRGAKVSAIVLRSNVFFHRHNAPTCEFRICIHLGSQFRSNLLHGWWVVLVRSTLERPLSLSASTKPRSCELPLFSLARTAGRAHQMTGSVERSLPNAIVHNSLSHRAPCMGIPMEQALRPIAGFHCQTFCMRLRSFP